MTELKNIVNQNGFVASLTVHWEFQAKESSHFLSYFKDKPQYVQPKELKKVDFNAIATLKQSRKLYQLKGKKNVRVRQVEVSHKSLNSGDVFILDADDLIYQWNGKFSSRMEKAKALDLTTRLRDEKAAKSKLVQEDEGQESAAFWQELGGKGPIATADEGGNDDDFERQELSRLKLYK